MSTGDAARQWSIVSLADLAAPEPNSITDGPFGSKLKTVHYTSTGPRVVRLQNIGDGIFIDERAHISESHFSTLQKHRVYPGDLLIAALGESLPRACVAPPSLGPAIVKADCIRYKPNNHLVSCRYLLYALVSPQLKHQAATIVHGIGRPRLNQGEIKSLRVPVAPRPEQDVIVAEIEKQFTRLDTGVAALKRVQAHLRRYRTALLKAAFKGGLASQRDSFANDARSELEQILKRAPIARDDGPALPPGWCWASASDLFSLVTSGSRGWAKYYSDSGAALFIRIGNLDRLSIKLDLSSIQRVSPPASSEGTRTRLACGDLLISITADIGMVAAVPPDFPKAYVNQHLALARPIEGSEPRYLAWFLASPPGQQQLRSMKRGATKAGLGLDDIRGVWFPLPPRSEQRRLVGQIEMAFAEADSIEKAVVDSVARAARLRASILRDAFTGEFLPARNGLLPRPSGSV